MTPSRPLAVQVPPSMCWKIATKLPYVRVQVDAGQWNVMSVDASSACRGEAKCAARPYGLRKPLLHF